MPSDPSSSPRFHALVPCAGAGSRAGSAVAKQYVEIAGRPLVAHTLAALAQVDRLECILVVVAPDDASFAPGPGIADERIAVARCGGPTRAATVRAGLAELARRGARPDDWVLVHDAARCLVRSVWIDALIDACRDDPIGGLLAIPVADTLKREDGGRAAATIGRERLWQAQTPQMFRLGALIDALDRAGPAVSDEAGAIEAAGGAPKLVPGSPENLKITHPGDFAIAGALLEARRA
ncbi:MAG TPA: 2-C-methyl-D-erythritol 4-phosphate cytidylyltransferase [Caldimonas sp.]|jgi:2-C-methyl-D-erythritol 4-phosphate cytidylyltransferase|nr:2-C-methyl-D-erythritol 4-phosphate cytidylyltransferase [Caldimonas sp.]HEX2541744.1 2-C-methyl-D-erythritol 4-phosphate cytidylyltransferase [Caldimonas sp.]